jgi:outer membrane protein assembly factor BamB
VADASRVYALFATGALAAFDHEGKPVWSRNLAADYGAFSVMWIYGASPLLLGDRLIIPVLQRTPVPRDYGFAQDGKAERDSFLLCLDAATGTNLWRQIRKSEAVEETQEAYTTPIPWQRGGKTEILLFGANHLTAHDPASGAELWRSVDLNPSHERWWRVVPSPVAASDLVIVCNPKRAPVHALRPGADRSAAIAWSFSDFPSDCVTPLLYRGRLYVLDGDRQMMTCLDPASGRKLWEGSLGVRDIFRASPTGADGRVYCLSEKGNTVVLEAGEEFKILATNWLGDEPVRSSIPVADGRVYIRTASTLWCVRAEQR